MTILESQAKSIITNINYNLYEQVQNILKQVPTNKSAQRQRIIVGKQVSRHLHGVLERTNVLSVKLSLLHTDLFV